jgi:hypothetical protein
MDEGGEAFQAAGAVQVRPVATAPGERPVGAVGMSGGMPGVAGVPGALGAAGATAGALVTR